MKRLVAFLMALLIAASVGMSPQGLAAASEENVQVAIHLIPEGNDEPIPGTEQLVFNVYDLTTWRNENEHSEKAAKQYLLDTYATKEAMRRFVAEEQLQLENQEPILVNTNQIAELTLSRYKENKDAAYLILASGETGNQHFLPIVLFFPQIDPKTKEESRQLQIYGKYVKLSDSTPAPAIEGPKPPGGSSSRPAASQDQQPATSPAQLFPQTNELRQSYIVLGGLLSLIGAIGLMKNKKIRRKKE